MRAVERRGCADRLCVLLSMDSVLEYPEFYLRFIDGRFPVESVWPPMAQALHPGALNVTGEHGDQLFGSQLLAPYVRRGVAHEPYRDLLPLVMLERLRNPVDAWRVGRYLQPVLDAAPAPIVSLFDALWWLNFSLKWQDVSLRMVGLSGGLARSRFGALRHFFRTDAFQRWSMVTTPGRPVPSWTEYKTPAKDYIRAFSGDERYFRQKIKEDSLRNVLGASGPVMRNQIYMREDFRPVVTRRATAGGGTPCAVVPGSATTARPGLSRVREISHVGPLGAGIAGAADWGGDPEYLGNQAGAQGAGAAARR